MDRRINVISYDSLIYENSVLVVITFPCGESDENVTSESKLTVIGFGFEGDVGRSALLSGGPYKAAVAMFPDYVGAALVDSALMLLDGQDVSTYTCPTIVINNDNFATYYTDNGDGTFTTNFAAIDELLASK